MTRCVMSFRQPLGQKHRFDEKFGFNYDPNGYKFGKITWGVRWFHQWSQKMGRKMGTIRSRHLSR
jgi:hypothetical protein